MRASIFGPKRALGGLAKMGDAANVLGGVVAGSRVGLGVDPGAAVDDDPGAAVFDNPGAAVVVKAVVVFWLC